jgi:tryptophan-rich sensory protein
MMQTPVRFPTSVGHQAIALIGWLVLCFAAATSAVFVSVDGWYAALNKPSWNPPSWLFGPVWTLLYIMMAIAAWLVWRKGGWTLQRWPLGLFVIQWLLNAIWTPLFFGMHLIGLALVDIVLLWIAIVATLAAFWRVSKPAAWLLVPYLAWVSFATALNFAIWQLNR